MMFNRSKEQEKKEAKKEKICSFRFRIVLVSFSRLYMKNSILSLLLALIFIVVQAPAKEPEKGYRGFAGLSSDAIF